MTPAVFADVDSARSRFAERSWLARVTLNGSPPGGFVCGAMCLARPIVARLAPRLEPDVPAQVARDGVQHSFAAYSDALNSMWGGNPLAELLRRPPCPITVLLAEQDSTCSPTSARARRWQHSARPPSTSTCRSPASTPGRAGRQGRRIQRSRRDVHDPCPGRAERLPRPGALATRRRVRVPLMPVRDLYAFRQYE